MDTRRLSQGKNDEASKIRSQAKSHLETELDILLSSVNRSMGVVDPKIGPRLLSCEREVGSCGNNGNIQSQSSGARLKCEGHIVGPCGKRLRTKTGRRKRKVGHGALGPLKCIGQGLLSQWPKMGSKLKCKSKVGQSSKATSVSSQEEYRHME
ncbi:hypothetical protein Ancab_006106 [Ancistrocladus abbreviatus]